jgi:transposase
MTSLLKIHGIRVTHTKKGLVMLKPIKKTSKTPAPSASTNPKPKIVADFKLKPMDPCVAGIDIGASSVFTCIGFPDGRQEVKEHLTFTEDLKLLLKWLQESGIKRVAMESTGVYWIPVYDILAEGGMEVTLVNAYYLKTVPGRKTDVKDCQWIQQLHAYGLLSGSFRPDDEGVMFRGFVRHRSRLFESAAQQIQLMHKALTQMNLQINHVLSDITGVTGQKIIRAIVAGERDPHKLALNRDRRCTKTTTEIAKALEGNYREEHLLSLKHSLEAYDFFHKQALECENSIEKLLNKWELEQEPKNPPDDTHSDGQSSKRNAKKTAHNMSPYHFEAATSLENILRVDLTQIPGLDVNGLMKIIAEIGRDMSKWATSKHFASWLGLCPGNKISGGKILSGRTKPSANRAAQALRLAANALYRSGSALGAYFRRMRARLGAPKAITATAHKLAVILYTMIKERKDFKEIGQDAYEQKFQERKLKFLAKQAKDLGYKLTAC